MLGIDEIKVLAKKITSGDDRKEYNSIIKLVQGLKLNGTLDEDSTDEQNLRFLTVALFQIFKKLFVKGELSLRVKKPELLDFNKWCRKLYDTFKANLLKLIAQVDIECSLTLDCMDIYMQLLEQESTHFASTDDATYFPNKTLQKLIKALFTSTVKDDELDPKEGQSQSSLISEFTEKYYKEYVDVQYYFQAEFLDLLEKKELEVTPIVVGKWLTIVNHDKYLSNAEVELEIFVSNPPQAIENESRFKSNLEKNWLLVLNGHLSINQYKTVLLILHRRIIPYFQTPTRLMDFLTDSYNLQSSRRINADVVPILALNGLFELIKSSGLEYPNFYGKLYQLVTPDLMHVKYRSRFFRLMDIFLSSTHISAHLVASFIKKLARYSLTAPPGAIVTIIPFIYNLLKKHPSCMIMIHDPYYMSDPFFTPEQRKELSDRQRAYNDPFDIESTSPEQTHAMESSLWELKTLMDHYHPNVATLAKIFAQQFRKMHYNMEDFLDWSYDTLLEAESTRKLKVLPTLEFEEFKGIFDKSGQDNNDYYMKGIAW
ncbi:Nucleolar complex protein 4 [Nakaseomyces bracarensis]|uniref:Nucleolar complex protein 4 n=1 Tax=Nakaseomyces bracarensis TaxID=273131 RepID=A0ABR4NPL9_9SACH